MGRAMGDYPTNYSVVIPIYNEEQIIPALVNRVTAVLNVLEGISEVIFINDGSTDASLELLRQAHTADSRLKVLSFSRNFGHQLAISAGLDYAEGQAVVIMDGDLQDPPELIPELIAKWREGYEVVYAVRARREGETAFKRWTAALFYRVVRRLTNIAIPLDVGDFRLIGRRAVDYLCRMRESHRFLRGMVSWVGFAQTGVSYNRAARQAGTTKYPLRKMLALALDGITSFSAAPLKIATTLGTCTVIIGLLALICLAVPALQPVVHNWPSVGLLLIGGIQLLSLGILGEYLGRIYDEVRRRPLYIVAETIGIGAMDERKGERMNE